MYFSFFLLLLHFKDLKGCVVFIWFSEMGKFMKPGKVVMVLAGRYAGRKAVIVKVCINVWDFILFIPHTQVC